METRAQLRSPYPLNREATLDDRAFDDFDVVGQQDYKSDADLVFDLFVWPLVFFPMKCLINEGANRLCPWNDWHL